MFANQAIADVAKGAFVAVHSFDDGDAGAGRGVLLHRRVVLVLLELWVLIVHVDHGNGNFRGRGELRHSRVVSDHRELQLLRFLVIDHLTGPYDSCKGTNAAGITFSRSRSLERRLFRISSESLRAFLFDFERLLRTYDDVKHDFNNVPYSTDYTVITL